MNNAAALAAIISLSVPFTGARAQDDAGKSAITVSGSVVVALTAAF